MITPSELCTCLQRFFRRTEAAIPIPAGSGLLRLDPSAAAFNIDVSIGAFSSSSCSEGFQSNFTMSLMVFTQKVDGEGTVLQSVAHSPLIACDTVISRRVALQRVGDLEFFVQCS